MSDQRTEPPHPDNDHDDLDQVAADVHAAVEAGGIADRWIDRDAESDESKAAAAAYRAITHEDVETAATDTRDIEPAPPEARSIEALAAITNRIPPGYMRVAIDIPNPLASEIIGQRLAPNAKATNLDLLDALAAHIIAHLPATIGPPPAEVWLERITAMQTEMWADASEVRS